MISSHLLTHIINEFIENDFKTRFDDVHKGMTSVELSAPTGFCKEDRDCTYVRGAA